MVGKKVECRLRKMNQPKFVKPEILLLIGQIKIGGPSLLWGDWLGCKLLAITRPTAHLPNYLQILLKNKFETTQCEKFIEKGKQKNYKLSMILVGVHSVLSVGKMCNICCSAVWLDIPVSAGCIITSIWWADPPITKYSVASAQLSRSAASKPSENSFVQQHIY